MNPQTNEELLVEVKRLKAEVAKLQANCEERLQVVLEAARMGMWDWNLVSGEITWSREHEALFGLATGSFDGNYKTFDNCLYPDDRDSFNQAINHALETCGQYHHEFRVRWADGSLHWIEGRGKAFYNENGQPIRMIGTVMGIDDRKQIDAQQNQLIIQEQMARRAAETAQKQVTSILESISDAFVSLDSQWRYSYVNQKAGQLFNRRPEDLIGVNIWDEFPEGVGQTFYHAYYRAVVEQQPIQIEEYYSPWDRWFENRIYPSKEGLTIFFQEITDRKRTEIALQHSERYLRAVQNTAPECVKVITATGILDSINPAGLAILEADSLEQVRGRSIFPLINDRYREAFQAFTQQVANGQAGIFEFEGTGLKGSHRWLETHAVPLQTGTAATQVLAITRDITARKQAEISLRQAEAALRQTNQELENRVAQRTMELQAANDSLLQELIERKRTEQALRQSEEQLQLALANLQASELKFHAVFNQSLLFIELLQPDGTVFEVNQRCDGLTAMVGEELIGRRFWELAIWGQDKQSQMQAVFERALAGEVVSIEMDIHTLDGSLLRTPESSLVTHDVRVKAVKNPGGQVMFLTVEAWDISALKQAEAALQQSEERFRNAFDNAPIGLALVGTDGKWLKTNAALSEIVGYSEAELLTTTFQTITHPDDLETDLDYVNQLLNDKIRSYEMEKRYFHKQGHLIWVQLNVSLVRDRHKQPLYLISQIQDITARRTVERLKREFISVVSHELRTPLTAIRGSLGILATGALQQHPERAQRMIEIATIDTERLVRLVNEILDLERLESGRVTLTKEVCSAAMLMVRSVEVVRSIAQKENITLTIAPTDAQVSGSADHLIQTLTNLLSNAIKFSPAGSTIELSANYIESQESAEKNSLDSTTASVLFCVSDQGRGIPADKLETIFGRFQQVDASDSRKKGGTGLGLAICRSIVQQHGGKIWVESLPGRGSQFYFTLPLPPEHELWPPSKS
jgi:PAS domain S-box-containing protein